MSYYSNTPQQNALEQWLEFYDRHMPAVRGTPKFGGGDFSRFDREERMKWALAQAGMGGGQKQPDFFGDTEAPGGMVPGGAGGGMAPGGAGGGAPGMPAFVKPERFNDPMPERKKFRSPMRGDIENYLAQFL